LQEIIENLLVAWHDEFAKKTNRSVLKMWTYMEAFAFWINSTSTTYWWGLDDGPRVGQTICLLGLALLETLHLMEQGGLLVVWTENVRNLPLVISLWLEGLLELAGEAMDCSEWEDPTSWPAEVQEYMHRLDIPIEGTYGIDKVLKQYAESVEEDEDLKARNEKALKRMEKYDGHHFTKWVCFLPSKLSAGESKS
jgi:hypothetical protein